MGSVTNHDRKRRLESLFFWCFAELKGIEPEDSTLEKLGFGSVEALRTQLGIWRVPDWVTQEESSDENERKARSGSGERQELPPAAEATPLFRQALQFLNEQVDLLETRKEYVQDERFVAQDEHHAPIFWTRPHGMSDDDWRALCEKLGQSSDSDGFELWESALVEPAGATQSPQEPLTTLIAVYLLAGLPPEPLLDRLHFASETVDIEEIKRHLDGVEERKRGADGKIKTQHKPGLKTKAAQLARLMRGGLLRRGPSTEELSPEEQNIIWYRQQRARDGVPDATIFRELKEKRGLSKAEYQRLKKFRLDFP
jgi:hypothetical protein